MDAVPPPPPPGHRSDEPRAALEEALFEIKRVIVGQDAMLERLLVSLLAGGLKAVYERLGSQLGKKKEKRQVTSAVAGGGLLLLVGGAALSLGFFGRLV